ncbi:MAG: acyl-CoA synthetase [Myxococcaceae bacterium]|nr:acyl-CoA synthetase [Myxococcaceae bacterium]
MSTGIYDLDLGPNAANFTQLSPLSFIAWSAEVYPQRVAVIHGARRFSWRETYTRSRRLASALQRRGVEPGQTVSAMLANTPEMYEAHFGVPMSGAVLNAINTRLDPDAVAFILRHAEAKVVLIDREYAPVMQAALAQLDHTPLVIDVLDPEYQGPGDPVGGLDYERLLDEGDPEFAWQLPTSEWDAISLNYTSGTTGNPKGVVYHHRGAHLTALSNALEGEVPRHAVYLWTLPMFHCNGWCFPWTMAAKTGVNICLRRFDAEAIFKAFREHDVTHYCGAPVVHSMLIEAPATLRAGITQKISALVGGAAPSLAMVEGMARIGIDLTHIYGLTEVYGPTAVCAKSQEWQALEPSEQARCNGRQGVRVLLQEGCTVMDPETMQEVPRDGTTIGEIMFRGNLTMKGYLKNEPATSEAFRGGWFHSGDLAVLEPDGYAKIKDRSKDIIISGGENISSLEVEDTLYRHPSVLVCAVVAQYDEKWGESPCAFVELRPGTFATEAEIIDHCRAKLARFKAPRRVIFGSVPRTSTGKIQKFVLRDRANAP